MSVDERVYLWSRLQDQPQRHGAPSHEDQSLPLLGRHHRRGQRVLRYVSHTFSFVHIDREEQLYSLANTFSWHTIDTFQCPCTQELRLKRFI